MDDANLGALKTIFMILFLFGLPLIGYLIWKERNK
jgi:hypothetical protein